LALSAFATSASADCAYPKAPDALPNGSTASEAEMKAAMDAFKSYNDAVNAYGACLEEETSAKTSTMAAAQIRQLKTIQSKKYNSAVEELKAKAEQFNSQVRAFKARSG
jgi:hypothetical protein